MINKPSALEFIRNAILAASTRSEQYDEIASKLGLTRHQAKVLYFAFMFRAEEVYLEGMVAAFESVNGSK